MDDLIYVWLEPGVDPSAMADAGVRSAPALRAWGDAILEIGADRFGISVAPPISIRRDAVFGWQNPDPPASRAPAISGRICHEFQVSADLCASAAIERVDELFDPSSWRRLAVHLSDQEGFSAELIGEELVPTADPTVPALVDRTRAVVESTEPKLLDSVLAFFEEPIRRYLGSWVPLSSLGTGERSPEREVVIPREAVRRVVRGVDR